MPTKRTMGEKIKTTTDPGIRYNTLSELEIDFPSLEEKYIAHPRI